MEKNINLRITARETEAVNSLRKIQGGMEGLRKSARSFLGLMGGGLAGYVSLRGVTGVLGQMVENARAAEVSQRRLQAVLKATGHAAGITAGEIEDLAQQMARSTAFDDESLRDAAGTMLSFRNVTRETFNEALSLSADLSQFMGQDLHSSVVQVGKALNDPIRGMSALARVGITFDSQQRKSIQTFMEQNRLIDAQRIIMKELAEEFGGAAESMNTGLNKSLRDVKKSWDDLLEAMGRTPSVQGPVSGLLDALSKQVRDFTAEVEKSQNLFEVYLRYAARTNIIPAVRYGAGGLADLLFPHDPTDLDRARERGASVMRVPARPTKGGGTPPPTGPTSPKSGVDKVQATIERLRFEQQQLQRTAEGQRLYNELKNAGIGLNHKAAGTISALVEQLYREEQAKKVREMVGELAFEQAQLSRTAEEQRLYNELKSAGVELASAEGQAIAQAVAQLTREEQARKVLNLREELQFEAEQLVRTSAERRAYEELRALGIDAASEEGRALSAQIIEMERYADAQREALAIIESTLTPYERYDRTLEKLEDLYRRGALNLDQWTRALEAADAELVEGLKNSEEKLNELGEFTKEAFRSMQNVASDFFFDVLEGNFTDLGENFRKMVNRMLADWMAVKAMGALFGSSFSSTGQLGGLLGAGLSAVGGFFGGGAAAGGGELGGGFTSGSFSLRAGGGPVYPGQTYIVGEKGPELFRAPTYGNIIPNGSGGSTINVPVTLQGDDKALAAKLQRRIERAVADELRRQV